MTRRAWFILRFKPTDETDTQEGNCAIMPAHVVDWWAVPYHGVYFMDTDAWTAVNGKVWHCSDTTLKEAQEKFARLCPTCKVLADAALAEIDLPVDKVCYEPI